MTRSSPGCATAPRFYIVNQHIGWLKMYVIGMDENNWRDMRDRAELQLERLSQEIDKEAAAIPDTAATPPLPKRPFAFAVKRAPDNGPEEYRLFMDEGEAREAAEQLDGDYEALFRVGDRRSAVQSLNAAQPSWQPIIERLCKPEAGHTIHDVVANYRAIRRDALALSSTQSDGPTPGFRLIEEPCEHEHCEFPTCGCEVPLSSPDRGGK